MATGLLSSFNPKDYGPFQPTGQAEYGPTIPGAGTFDPNNKDHIKAAKDVWGEVQKLGVGSTAATNFLQSKGRDYGFSDANINDIAGQVNNIDKWGLESTNGLTKLANGNYQSADGKKLYTADGRVQDIWDSATPPDSTTYVGADGNPTHDNPATTPPPVPPATSAQLPPSVTPPPPAVTPPPPPATVFSDPPAPPTSTASSPAGVDTLTVTPAKKDVAGLHNSGLLKPGFGDTPESLKATVDAALAAGYSLADIRIGVRAAGNFTNEQLAAAGLNGAAPATTNATTASGTGLAGTERYTASEATVDPTKTTQGLLESMLDNPNSSYLQRARALSMEKFNERGLGSSSLAQGAGVAAAIDAALGIATPDAQIYSNTNLSNANARNEASRFNAGASNAASLQANAQAYDSTKTDKTQGFELNKLDKIQGFTTANMSLDQKNRLVTMAAQHGYNLDTMTAQQANDLVKLDKIQGFDMAKMDKGQINDLAKMAVAQGYNLDTISAQQANVVKNMVMNQGFNLESMEQQQVNDLFKMGTAFGYDMQKLSSTQAHDLQTMYQRHQYDLDTMSVDDKNQLKRMSINQGYVKEIAGIQKDFDIEKMEKNAALTLAQMDKAQVQNLATMATKFGYDMQMMSANQINALEQIRATGSNQLAAAGVGASTSLQLAALNADANKALQLNNQDFQKAIYNSTQAAGIMKDLQTNLTGIDMNPNFTGNKDVAKDNYVKTTRLALSVWGHSAGDQSLLAAMDLAFPPAEGDKASDPSGKAITWTNGKWV